MTGQMSSRVGHRLAIESEQVVEEFGDIVSSVLKVRGDFTLIGQVERRVGRHVAVRRVHDVAYKRRTHHSDRISAWSPAWSPEPAGQSGSGRCVAATEQEPAQSAQSGLTCVLKHVDCAAI